MGVRGGRNAIEPASRDLCAQARRMREISILERLSSRMDRHLLNEGRPHFRRTLFSISATWPSKGRVEAATHPLGLLARRGGHDSSRLRRICPQPVNVGVFGEPQKFRCTRRGKEAPHATRHGPSRNAAFSSTSLLQLATLSSSTLQVTDGKVASMRDVNGRDDERSQWALWWRRGRFDATG